MFSGPISLGSFGVGDGNRTRNVRSHSPVLCQVELLPPRVAIITTGGENCVGVGWLGMSFDRLTLS